MKKPKRIPKRPEMKTVSADVKREPKPKMTSKPFTGRKK